LGRGPGGPALATALASDMSIDQYVANI